MTDARRGHPAVWALRTRDLTLERPLVMGILNVTPDSFSDGGLHDDAGRAVAHGLALIEDGADLIDVGGESTRPGAAPVSEHAELERVEEVVTRLAGHGAVVSIDTMKPHVAARAIAAGAEAINDVTGFTDPQMVDVAAGTGAGLIVMHMQGEPRTMQQAPSYDDVVAEVAGFLAARTEELVAAGVDRVKVVVDPGIGFGKELSHNLELLQSLDRLVAQGQPVLIGPSRKRFLGTITGRADPADRDPATAVVAALAVAAGVRVIRAHNVALIREAVEVADAIVRGTWRSRG